jgi:hypothetical protein
LNQGCIAACEYLGLAATGCTAVKSECIEFMARWPGTLIATDVNASFLLPHMLDVSSDMAVVNATLFEWHLGAQLLQGGWYSAVSTHDVRSHALLHWA